MRSGGIVVARLLALGALATSRVTGCSIAGQRCLCPVDSAVTEVSELVRGEPYVEIRAEFANGYSTAEVDAGCVDFFPVSGPVAPPSLDGVAIESAALQRWPS